MTRARTLKLAAALLAGLAALPALAAPASVPKELTFRIGGGLQGVVTLSFKDGKLTCEQTRGAPEMPVAQTSPEAWQQFRAALDEVNVWRWRSAYANPYVLDGTVWNLHVRYADKVVGSSGANEYPNANGGPNGSSEYSESFNQLRAALMKLAVGCLL